MDNKERSKDSVGCLPNRYIVAILLFLSCCLAYMVRTNLNITIVAMVNETSADDNETLLYDDFDQCPDTNAVVNESLPIQTSQKYNWDADTQSFLLSSFYYGYISTQFVGGFLCERFGPKLFIGGATLLGAILTLLTPLAASWNVTALLVLRVITGITQGAIFPSTMHYLNSVLLQRERSVVIMLVLSGCGVGTIVAMEAGGYLCKYGFAGGWPSVYYVFGSVSVVWVLVWFMSGELTSTQIQEKSKIWNQTNKKISTPLKSIFTSLPVWGFVVGHSSSSWTAYMTLTELPTYISHVLHLPIEENGSVNAIIYVIGTVVSILAGLLADYLISRKNSQATLIRKMMQNLGHYGSAICFLCIPLAGCNHTLVIALLTASRGFSSIPPVSEVNIIADMAPAYSGTIYGLGNTFASLMGVLAPTVTGAFIRDGMGKLSKWRWIFTIAAAVDVTGAILFLAFANAKKQHWAGGVAEDRQHLVNTHEDEQKPDSQ